MRNEMLDSLSKSGPNEWLRISREAENLDEMLTATYLRAMQEDCFKHYAPEFPPYPPTGWDRDYMTYHSVSDDKKADAWRTMLQKYAGYIKALNEREYRARSNASFVRDMLEHFKKKGMTSYAEKCEQRLREFREIS